MTDNINENSVSILLIEHSPKEAAAIMDALSGHSFRIITSAEPGKAYKEIEKNAPDIVLVDSGHAINIIKRLVKISHKASSKVIVFINKSSLEKIDPLLETGIDDFAIKDNNIKILLPFIIRKNCRKQEIPKAIPKAIPKTDLSFLIEKTEAKNRALINAIPDIVFQLDKDSVCLDFHSGIDDEYLNSIDIIGKKISDVIPMHIAEITQSMLEKSLDTKSIQEYGFVFDMPGGLRHFRAKIAPVNDEELIVIATDITEQVNVKEKLLRTNENLSVTLNSIGDGVIATDSSGIITGMNPVAETMTGWTQESAIGASLDEVFIIYNAETNQKIISPVYHVLMNGQTVGLANHTKLVSKDGSEYQIADSASPIRKKDGSIIGVVLIFNDVTEQYARDNALKESEEMLSMAQKVANIGSWVYYFESDLMWGSEESFKIYGKKRLDPFTKYSETYDLVHPDDISKLSFNKKRLIDNNELYNVEFRIFREDDGVLRILQSIGDIVRNENGKPIKIVGTVQDITERKLTEKALLDSERKYRELYENMREGICSVNMKGKIIEFNKAFQMMTGYSSEELYKLNYKDITPKKWHELEDKIIKEQLLIKNYSDIYEKEYLRKDKSTFPVELRTYILKDSNGKKIGMWALIKDISKRLENEKRLLESENKFRTLTETASSIIFIIQGNKFLYMNKTGEILCGYTMEQLKEMNFWDFIHADFVNIVKERGIGRQEGLDIPANYELKILNPELGERWWDFTAARIDFEGEPATLGTAFDITDRKILSEQIKRSEEKYRKIFELSPEAIILIDKDSKIIDINEHMENWLGYERNSIIGRSVLELESLPHISKKKIEKNLETLARNKRSNPIELDFVSKDDKIKVGWMFSTTLLDNMGESVSNLLIINDITDRKKAEEEIKTLNKNLEKRVVLRTSQLQNALDELEEEIKVRKIAEMELLNAKENLTSALEKEKELNELKTRFLSMISHEYRTPLTVILTSTYIIDRLFEGKEREEFDKFLSKIRNSVETMTQLHDNVLTIGKSEAGTLKIYPSNIDIIKLSDEILEEMKIIEDKKHFYVFNKNFEKLELYTDIKLIRQLLSNLLSNAAKYSPEESTVALDIIADKINYTIRVSDQGMGIADEDKKRLFESFHRGGNIGAISGTGLGLAIVKKCVDAFKGVINFESELDKGTVFTVVLPRNIQN